MVQAEANIISPTCRSSGRSTGGVYESINHMSIHAYCLYA